MKKLLFYGGGFDPPHLGHERLFASALAAVQPDKALVIPTGVSPHKTRSRTPFWDRFAMAKCFLKAGAQVEVSPIEAKGHRCYTFETIKRLQKRYPGYELYMLIGSDNLTGFHTWHLYRRILARVTVVAGCRDDADEQAFYAAAKRLSREGAKLQLLRFEPVEVSSTQLRKALAEGGDVSALVSPEVSGYIKKRGLYGVAK